MIYVAISIGAVLGANARYLVGGWLGGFGSSFPYGTLLINVTGSLVVGIVLGLGAGRVVPWWWRSGVAIGFLGSYTTFSTFSYETLDLVQQGSYVAATANMVASFVLSLGAVAVGVAIARAI